MRALVAVCLGSSSSWRVGVFHSSKSVDRECTACSATGWGFVIPEASGATPCCASLSPGGSRSVRFGGRALQNPRGHGLRASALTGRSSSISGPFPGLLSDGITTGSHVAGCACSCRAWSPASAPSAAGQPSQLWCSGDSPHQAPPAFTAYTLLQQHPAGRNGEDGSAGMPAVGTEGTYSARWASIRGGDR